MKKYILRRVNSGEGRWKAIDKHRVCGYLKCNNHDNKLELTVNPAFDILRKAKKRERELWLVECAGSCFSLDYGNLIS